jgi:hypothetical protein
VVPIQRGQHQRHDSVPSSVSRVLTSGTRTDGHLEVEALASRRVEEVQARKAVDSELGKGRARRSRARAVLAAGEALAGRADARSAAARAAPDPARVVGRERDGLGCFGGEGEASREDSSALDSGEECGVDLSGTVVENVDGPVRGWISMTFFGTSRDIDGLTQRRPKPGR